MKLLGALILPITFIGAVTIYLILRAVYDQEDIDFNWSGEEYENMF